MTSSSNSLLCMQSWVGSVTELIPPNYGIVDGDAYFASQIVIGNPPQVTATWLLASPSFAHMHSLHVTLYPTLQLLQQLPCHATPGMTGVLLAAHWRCRSPRYA